MTSLRTGIWVDALVRRADAALASAYVIRRGDEDAGAVLVKVVDADRLAHLYVPVRDEHGERIWTRFRGGPVSEADADAYCARRCEDDTDMWIVEIVDRQARHFLTEPVEKT